jgi:hypothetical protein
MFDQDPVWEYRNKDDDSYSDSECSEREQISYSKSFSVDKYERFPGIKDPVKRELKNSLECDSVVSDFVEGKRFFLDWMKEDDEICEKHSYSNSHYPVAVLFYCQKCCAINSVGAKSFKDPVQKICQKCSSRLCL